MAGICWQSQGVDHSAHYYHASELIFGLAGGALTLVGVGDTEQWVGVGAGQCIVPGPLVSHRTKTDASSPYECLYFFVSTQAICRRVCVSRSFLRQIACECSLTALKRLANRSRTGMKTHQRQWRQLTNRSSQGLGSKI